MKSIKSNGQQPYQTRTSFSGFGHLRIKLKGEASQRPILFLAVSNGSNVKFFLFFVCPIHGHPSRVLALCCISWSHDHPAGFRQTDLSRPNHCTLTSRASSLFLFFCSCFFPVFLLSFSSGKLVNDYHMTRSSRIVPSLIFSLSISLASFSSPSLLVLFLSFFDLISFLSLFFPTAGKMDIDYHILHDAFFKYQTKPHLTPFGDMYYEGLSPIFSSLCCRSLCVNACPSLRFFLSLSPCFL